jgi:hypothetical protein
LARRGLPSLEDELKEAGVLVARAGLSSERHREAVKFSG